MKKQTLLSVILSFLLLSSTLFSSINPNSYLEKHNKLSQTVSGLYGGAGGLSTYQLLNLEEPVTSAAMAIPLANIAKGEAVASGVKVGSGVTEAGNVNQIIKNAESISTAKAGQYAAPRNLNEQIMWKQVVENPSEGQVLGGLNNDPRFPIEAGFSENGG